MQTDHAPELSRRGLILGGVAAVAFGVLGHVTSALRPPGGDVSAAPLPSWAASSERSTQAYRVALARPDLLAGLHCYCGCEQFEQPHASLRDCFLRADGSFEPHASGCDTCQDEAIDAAQWDREGIPRTEIRQRIDTTYGERGPGCGILSCG